MSTSSLDLLDQLIPSRNLMFLVFFLFKKSTNVAGKKMTTFWNYNSKRSFSLGIKGLAMDINAVDLHLVRLRPYKGLPSGCGLCDIPFSSQTLPGHDEDVKLQTLANKRKLV